MARLTICTASAVDGYPLEVSVYEPFKKSEYEQVVVLNSGAGIPRVFYESFAAWLADEGLPVATYDYRGIGGSRGRTIRSLRASIQDWGSKDCAGILATMRTWYPTARLSVIAHSIGGVVTGFVTSPPKIDRMLLISPHTGFFGDYEKANRWRMFFLWHVVMPVVTRTAGYFPGRRLGFPEDLPYEVALEWGRRRRLRDLRLDRRLAQFDHIAAPVLVLRPTDDPFATTAAMERVKRHYQGATFLDVSISSDPLIPREIGHFGFFRSRSRQRLWPIALKWLMKGRAP